jgi:hypothetical protein
MLKGFKVRQLVPVPNFTICQANGIASSYLPGITSLGLHLLPVYHRERNLPFQTQKLYFQSLVQEIS